MSPRDKVKPKVGKKSAAVGNGKAAGRLKLKPILVEETVCEWVCGWEFERTARAEGSLRVAGVDEVGRGPLFGPVVAAAVILPHDAELDDQLDGLNDSKKLTEEEREHFSERVRKVALAWSVAEVDVATIDRINILQASKLAMCLAVDSLGRQGWGPDHLLIDGNQKIDAVCRQTTIVSGDARSLSIAAASVIAKVHRDRLLCELDVQYPGYGLARNKGYSTPEHKEALMRLGATEMHRRSFAPVAELFELEVETIDIEMGLFKE
ncbi:ribonuclease HII [Acidicapsa dinghuensis]|uniref:Ribonuclease HII n=1 Tax=Acidicapsa dinghuensis TaxID=2218256 RepID=A0ABW1ED59_9BACT|nr:ribonuclease HII [Acidicapsa dinghuensis]